MTLSFQFSMQGLVKNVTSLIYFMSDFFSWPPPPFTGPPFIYLCVTRLQKRYDRNSIFRTFQITVYSSLLFETRKYRSGYSISYLRKGHLLTYYKSFFSFISRTLNRNPSICQQKYFLFRLKLIGFPNENLTFLSLLSCYKHQMYSIYIRLYSVYST